MLCFFCSVVGGIAKQCEIFCKAVFVAFDEMIQKFSVGEGVWEALTDFFTVYVLVVLWLVI